MKYKENIITKILCLKFLFGNKIACKATSIGITKVDAITTSSKIETMRYIFFLLFGNSFYSQIYIAQYSGNIFDIDTKNLIVSDNFSISNFFAISYFLTFSSKMSLRLYMYSFSSISILSHLFSFW